MRQNLSAFHAMLAMFGNPMWLMQGFGDTVSKLSPKEFHSANVLVENVQPIFL
jgi:hypothetical protein